MTTVIETADLTKNYGGKVLAVDKLNISIEEGEIYGLLGPNGAGKTTTINMLTTRITPTSGSAKLAGHDIFSDSMAVRKIIGVVPQDLTADEDLTGRENLTMVAKFYDVPRTEFELRIEELLKLVGLTEAADRYVRQYSGGMRKRLELIIGLIHQPKILFLDEPTLGLDVQTRTQMWNYILKIQRDMNITIILTSHYLEEIDTLANRVSIIDHGHILVTGTPAELKEGLKGDFITLTFKTGEDAETMKKVQGALEWKDGGTNTIILKVDNSDEFLPVVIDYIAKNKLEAIKMAITKPTLDEVFLDYTGRNIRAEEAGDVRKSMLNMRRLRQ